MIDVTQVPLSLAPDFMGVNHIFRVLALKVIWPIEELLVHKEKL